MVRSARWREADKNLKKDGIIPTPAKKENWLVTVKASAGQRGAIVYLVIEGRRRRKIDPYAYFHDVLTRLPLMTINQG